MSGRLLAVLTAFALVEACSSTPATPAGSASPGVAPGRSVSPAQPPSQTPSQRVRWTSCGGGFQCGVVGVPENYASRDSPTLSLAVARRPATNAAERSGVLLVDFGGPGISGAETLRAAAALLPPALLQRFDLVSFDPRGTGRSGPLRCGPDDTGSTAASSAASSAAFVDAAVGAPPLAPVGQPLPVSAVYRQLYSGCQSADPALLATVNSTVQARDLDRIRQAVGAGKLRYLGLSYGTVLGLAYAKLYPQQVGAMVLDSPLDPTEPIADLARQQADAAEAALAHAFADGLGPAEAAEFDRLAARLRNGPLPAPGGTDTTPVSLSDLQLATLTYLQTPTLTPTYPGALTSALAGDGRALRELAASQYEDLDGTAIIGAYWSTICGDDRERPSPIVANTTARALDRRDPRLGAVAYTFAGGACTAWSPPTEPVALPTSRLPIALLGGTGDPIDPYVVAQSLSAKLPGSILITRVGEGHTLLGNSTGDSCLDAAVSGFLLDPLRYTKPIRCTDPGS